jgi:hypothetical protein
VANADLHSTSFGLGNVEQKQNTTIFLVTNPHLFFLRLMVNTWNVIKPEDGQINGGNV